MDLLSVFVIGVVVGIAFLVVGVVMIVGHKAE